MPARPGDMIGVEVAGCGKQFVDLEEVVLDKPKPSLFGLQGANRGFVFG